MSMTHTTHLIDWKVYSSQIGGPARTRTGNQGIMRAKRVMRRKWAPAQLYAVFVLGWMRLKKACFGGEVGTSTAQE